MITIVSWYSHSYNIWRSLIFFFCCCYFAFFKVHKLGVYSLCCCVSFTDFNWDETTYKKSAEPLIFVPLSQTNCILSMCVVLHMWSTTLLKLFKCLKEGYNYAPLNSFQSIKRLRQVYTTKSNEVLMISQIIRGICLEKLHPLMKISLFHQCINHGITKESDIDNCPILIPMKTSSTSHQLWKYW